MFCYLVKGVVGIGRNKSFVCFFSKGAGKGCDFSCQVASVVGLGWHGCTLNGCHGHHNTVTHVQEKRAHANP